MQIRRHFTSTCGIVTKNKMERARIIREILSSEDVRVLISYDPEVARYNAAVIQSEKDNLIMLREVQRNSVRPDRPDKGDLVIYRSTSNLVERVGKLNLQHPDVDSWEDVRAIIADDGKIVMGMTAIRASDSKPVAATMACRVENGNLSIIQESLRVYLKDRGKNVTPISETQFLFRREKFKHSLELVENGKDATGQDKLKVRKIIHFPIRSWSKWQIGTQAQILPGGIIPVHGINRYSLGIDQLTKKDTFGYTYSLGLVKLDENLKVIKITNIPLFTRESFKNILPMGIELDENKDVVYCCGYSIDEDVVKFIINIGDLMIVEVSKSLSELEKMFNVLQALPVFLLQFRPELFF